MSELLKSMTTRVVGVSFDNDDGTSRQDIISGLSVGEALLLNYHEYENEPAYAVTDALGNCIGHVSKELAATIYQKYKDCYFAVSVDDITGGDSGLKYGCVISIDIYDSAPETNENESSTAATVVDVIPAPVQNAESSKTNRVYSAMLTVIGALLILVGLVLLLIAPLGGAVAIVGGVFSIVIVTKKTTRAATRIAFVKPPSHATAKGTDRMFPQTPFYHKTVLFALVLFFILFFRMVIL